MKTLGNNFRKLKRNNDLRFYYAATEKDIFIQLIS